VSDQPFGDIPLFQEIQRLLQSGGGPINTEIARQVAKAAIKSGQPAPSKARESLFADEVRGAEMLLAGYTRLQVEEPSRAALVTPEDWVDATLTGWTWLFEALAASFTNTVGDSATGEGMGTMMGPVVPLMMGLQVGTLVGQLAGDSLGRYDLPIPRDDDGKIFLVEKNADAVVADYDFEPDAFRRWMALRETSRHLVVNSSPWAARYLRAAFVELVDSIEIDLSGLEQKLIGLQSGEGMESFSPTGALPLVPNERHSVALARLTAFITVFEGYSTHAVLQVAGELVPSAARIEEGMTRRAASPSEGSSALSSILGLSFDKRATARGATFCDAVAKLHGIQALNLVWSAPDNLPSAEELRDPFAWIERVVQESDL
jgi:putative hydrolase